MGKASSKPERPAEVFELQALPSTRTAPEAPIQSSRLLSPSPRNSGSYPTSSASRTPSTPYLTATHHSSPSAPAFAAKQHQSSKSLLHAHWLARQHHIHDLFAQYLHAYLNSLRGIGVREHQVLRSNLKALGRYVVWYSRKAAAMDRERLLDQSDVGLRGKVKSEYVELWKASFKLPG